MDKYISRDELLDIITERHRNTCNDKMSCLQMKRLVESLPLADVALKSEVASEIFAEIENLFLKDNFRLICNRSAFAELKKKYTEGG